MTALVYVTFMIEQDEKDRMEALAERVKRDGEKSNVSLEYRKAVRTHLKLNESE